MSAADSQPVGVEAHVVARGRRHVPEQQPTERVGLLRRERLSRGSHERHLRGGREAGDVHLLGAADRVKGRRRGGRAGGGRQTDDERKRSSTPQMPARFVASSVALTFRPALPESFGPEDQAGDTQPFGRLIVYGMIPR